MKKPRREGRGLLNSENRREKGFVSRQISIDIRLNAGQGLVQGLDEIVGMLKANGEAN